MKSKIQPVKPCIILLYGYPGSGKTAFANYLANEVNMVHLDGERLFKQIFKSDRQMTKKELMGVMGMMTREFLRAGVGVIYDLDSSRSIDRMAISTLAKHFQAEVLVAWMQIDPESAWSRCQKAQTKKPGEKNTPRYSSADFKRAIASQQNPSDENYVVVSGKHTHKSQKSAVLRKLYDMGVININQVSSASVKPELMSLVPQPKSVKQPDNNKRDISIK